MFQRAFDLSNKQLPYHTILKVFPVSGNFGAQLGNYDLGYIKYTHFS